MDNLTSLRRKISSARDLEAVVRTMKTIAASSIDQYERAVHSLDEYYRCVQLGLAACFHQEKKLAPYKSHLANIGVIVFGSDQGLVSQFNESMVAFVQERLKTLPGNKTLWAVGERLQAALDEAGINQEEGFILPNSIHSISSLVGQILIEVESKQTQGKINQVYLFHHRPEVGKISAPTCQQLLPLDESWHQQLADIQWPTNNLPEVKPDRKQLLQGLIREYLFVCIFRASAESLASENATRLAAMQRAEKNIQQLQENLGRTFNRIRQGTIDEELFDVISGFERLSENPSLR